MSDPFDELDKLQDLIKDKLAEIGIDVQLPVQFAKHPSGPRIIQLAGVMDDTSKIQSTFEEQDAFAAIVEAEKAAEIEQKLEAEKTAAEKARADLARLAEDDDDE